MAMNPMKLLQIKSAWDRFTQNHPKFPLFINAVQKQGIQEGAVLEMKVITPEGKELCTNVKLTTDDMELFRQLKDMSV